MATGMQPMAAGAEGNSDVVKDLLITAAGVTTTALTAWLLWFLEQRFQFALYSWNFWFVIPVGAMASGAVAASGYYAGALLLNHRPGRLLLGSVLAVSVATYFMVNYMNYTSLKVNNIPASELVSFPKYLDISLRSTSMSIHAGHGAKATETGELGILGYGVAVLQIIGFAMGGYLVYGNLRGRPYCSACAKYFRKDKSQTRYTYDSEALAALHQRLAQLAQSTQVDTAVAEHAAFGGPKQTKLTKLKSQLEVKRCPDCSNQWLKHGVARLEKNKWAAVGDLTFSTYVNSQPASPTTAA
jgi:hypothetical protein